MLPFVRKGFLHPLDPSCGGPFLVFSFFFFSFFLQEPSLIRTPGVRFTQPFERKRTAAHPFSCLFLWRQSYPSALTVKGCLLSAFTPGSFSPYPPIFCRSVRSPIGCLFLPYYESGDAADNRGDWFFCWRECLFLLLGPAIKERLLLQFFPLLVISRAALCSTRRRNML